jgi:hypothetical protein
MEASMARLRKTWFASLVVLALPRSWRCVSKEVAIAACNSGGGIFLEELVEVEGVLLLLALMRCRRLRQKWWWQRWRWSCTSSFVP